MYVDQDLRDINYVSFNDDIVLFFHQVQMQGTFVLFFLHQRHQLEIFRNNNLQGQKTYLQKTFFFLG